MVNAWSLAYDVLNGTLDENFPPMTDKNRVTPLESDEYDPITTVGSGSTDSAVFVDFNLNDQIDTINIDTSNFDTLNLTGIELPDGMSVNEDYVTPGIQKDCTRKYKEDESIKALQDYISTTYGGHYTSDNNNVQTLDLIESVGDAESFCRSNAIKYLSRYDKKGQAKRDILKALHYSLLLYHFSGQLNETPTRGYETF
jgi:hypothetical protein